MRKSTGCALLCSNTLQAADSLPVCHASMQIPAEKATSEFTSWVSTQDEKTVIRFLLPYVGLRLKHQSHAEGKAPHAFHLKKRQEVSFSSTQRQMGPGTHAVTKKAAATHTLRGRKDRSRI